MEGNTGPACNELDLNYKTWDIRSGRHRERENTHLDVFLMSSLGDRGSYSVC
jgi:hypothetical protein